MSSYNIDVRVDLRKKAIILDFPGSKGPDFAEAYYNQCKHSRTAHLKTDRVAIELPRDIDEVIASTSCDGFIFHFVSERLATDWTDALFRPVSDSSRKLYVKRMWNERALRKAIMSDDDDASEEQDQKRLHRPRKPMFSRTKT